MDITQIFGIAGAITYLASYALLQMGIIRGSSVTYALMNVAAAALVLVSLTTKFNIGSAIIQVSFISISIYGIGRLYFGKRSLTLPARDQYLVDTLLPGLPYRQARAFIDAGHWHRANNVVLTTQGVPSQMLYYLEKGSANVDVDTKTVTTLSSGSVIGDLTCLTNTPATANVTLIEESSYFAIQTSKLKPLLAKNEDLEKALSRGLSDQMRAKITAANARLKTA